MNVQRRARPLLGTLVEVGVTRGAPAAAVEAAIEAAFAAVAQVQACMSRFEPGSDIGRFHALAAGESICITARTADVLHASALLHAESEGLFDIAQGSPRNGWHCTGLTLTKKKPGVHLDLGGIAKGYAVDCAVVALQAAGCTAGWVNAGGDLRAFGSIHLPVSLRDEQHGGVRSFGSLSDGALATSQLGRQVSVMARQCLWADALTKVVALSGSAHHPLVALHGAQAWLH